MTEQNLPQHPAGADLRPVEGRWVVVLERRLHHPPEAVWAAITDPEQVRRWAPFAPATSLAAVGPVGLPFVGAPDEPEGKGHVRTSEAPHLLVLDWDEDELRLDLSPIAEGTLLRLTHLFTPRDQAPSMTAGWHLCLAALHASLDGLDLPPVAGEAAMQHGWQDLRNEYERIFAEA